MGIPGSELENRMARGEAGLVKGVRAEMMEKCT